MSRSIHETRHSTRLLGDTDFSELYRERPASVRFRPYRRLRLKRWMKRELPRRRRAGAEYWSSDSAGWIPIRVLDHRPGVHYPASVDDIREVLRRLPKEVATGLSGVVLQLYCRRPWAVDLQAAQGHCPDQITGRPGSEILPNVYDASVLGEYNRSTRAVCLHAYVWPSDRRLAPEWRLLLRAEMLGTLVHEVAHHHDNYCRARERWLFPSSTKAEAYAERLEGKWAHEVIIPYLRQAYPEAAAALEDWARRKSGASLPLELIAVAPHPLPDKGYGASDHEYPVWVSFGRFSFSVLKGGHLADAREEFAIDLHWADRNQEALAVLRAIEGQGPLGRRALVLKAGIRSRQGALSQALSLAASAVIQHPGYATAWVALAEIQRALGAWGAMRKSTEAALGLLPRWNDATRSALHLYLQALVNSGSREPAIRALERILRDYPIEVPEERDRLRSAVAAIVAGRPPANLLTPPGVENGRTRRFWLW